MILYERQSNILRTSADSFTEQLPAFVKGISVFKSLRGQLLLPVAAIVTSQAAYDITMAAAGSRSYFQIYNFLHVASQLACLMGLTAQIQRLRLQVWRQLATFTYMTWPQYSIICLNDISMYPVIILPHKGKHHNNPTAERFTVLLLCDGASERQSPKPPGGIPPPLIGRCFVAGLQSAIVTSQLVYCL